MTDLIRRADAIEAVRKEYEDAINIGDNGDAIAYDVGRILSALPSAEAVSRKEKCCPIAETCMSIDCPVSSEYIGRPSAEAEWIPCSERLPDDDGDYLVWLEDESDHYAVVYFDTGADAFGWWVDHYDPITLGFIESDFCETKNITAWQPLPTPYKGGDSE